MNNLEQYEIVVPWQEKAKKPIMIFLIILSIAGISFFSPFSRGCNNLVVGNSSSVVVVDNFVDRVLIERESVADFIRNHSTVVFDGDLYLLLEENFSDDSLIYDDCDYQIASESFACHIDCVAKELHDFDVYETHCCAFIGYGIKNYTYDLNHFLVQGVNKTKKICKMESEIKW